VALSGAALTFSIITWRKEQRERADQLRDEARRAADQKAAEDNKRDDELLAWSNRAIESMARIDALCRYDADDLEAGEFNRRERPRPSRRGFQPFSIRDGSSSRTSRLRGAKTQDQKKDLRPQILDELRLAYLVRPRRIASHSPSKQIQARRALGCARETRGLLASCSGLTAGNATFRQDSPDDRVKLDPLPGEADMANQEPYQAGHRR